MSDETLVDEVPSEAEGAGGDWAAQAPGQSEAVQAYIVKGNGIQNSGDH